MLAMSFVLRILFLPLRRSFFLRWNTLLIIYPFARFLMRVLGTRMKIHGKIQHSNQLVVSHHQGVIDSLMLMALSPCMVISNSNIRNLRGIGWVMEQLGFEFVDRSKHRSIQEVMKPAVTKIAEAKINVGFFPEGQSNDGLEMLPFKSPFFQIALEAECDVQPLVFQYTKANGRPVSTQDMDVLVYQQTQGSIVKYVFKMLRVKSIELDVEFLPRIPFERIKLENWSRKEICAEAESIVRPAFESR